MSALNLDRTATHITSVVNRRWSIDENAVIRPDVVIAVWTVRMVMPMAGSAMAAGFRGAALGSDRGGTAVAALAIFGASF